MTEQEIQDIEDQEAAREAERLLNEWILRSGDAWDQQPAQEKPY